LFSGYLKRVIVTPAVHPAPPLIWSNTVPHLCTVCTYTQREREREREREVCVPVIETIFAALTVHSLCLSQCFNRKWKSDLPLLFNIYIHIYIYIYVLIDRSTSLLKRHVIRIGAPFSYKGRCRMWLRTHRSPSRKSCTTTVTQKTQLRLTVRKYLTYPWTPAQLCRHQLRERGEPSRASSSQRQMSTWLTVEHQRYKVHTHLLTCCTSFTVDESSESSFKYLANEPQ
jgi:hypothetical protein